MKNVKQIDLGFCAAFPDREDGTEWILMMDHTQITAKSVEDIKARLIHAFELGMAFKAKQIRECLQIKETISLT